MKKAFTILFSSIIILYGWLGYDLISNQQVQSRQSSGKLSDIAEEVIAIPLETHHNCQLKQIELIKRDREHIFLISNQQLFHFHSSGKFVGIITSHEIEVIDYVIAPIHKCLIVIDTNKKVHYYDYNGQLLGQRYLPQEESWKSFGQIAYHDDYLWATIDLVNKNQHQQFVMEQWLYKFDLNFRVVEKRKLEVADLGRIHVNYSQHPEIKTYNGNVYVYTPSFQQAHILNDTLYLINSNQLVITNDYSKILPIQIGKRFLITSYENLMGSYTFCYDQHQSKSFQIETGWDDNFYQTGKISALQPMDLNAQTFCYVKRGEAIFQSFPQKAKEESPVLFIVKMKA